MAMFFASKADGSEAFVPDGAPLSTALARTTHLGIGAHPDDLEIMACHGILECYRNNDRWFTGRDDVERRRAARASAPSGTRPTPR